MGLWPETLEHNAGSCVSKDTSFEDLKLLVSILNVSPKFGPFHFMFLFVAMNLFLVRMPAHYRTLLGGGHRK